jgi:micrococcal nuclease
MLAFRRRSVVLLVVLLAGCSGSSSTETGLSHGPSGATAATHVQTAPRRVRTRFQAPKNAHPAAVTHISDGDTITLSGVGKVRLIGIDTPEVFGHSECFGRAASAFTKRVLRIGSRVEYRLGLEERDRYGRALAYVWLADGRMFNGLLAERGYATPLTIAPNVEYAELFLAAARRAREAGRGLWSASTCNGVNPPNNTGVTGGGDKDCADFASHAEAQQWFERHGGSGSNNVDNLDGRDGDGQVCESLP